MNNSLERSPRNEGREKHIDARASDVKRWSRFVDTLLRAFDGRDDAPPVLAARMEALRNKRDSVVTKVEALKHHKHEGWTQARRELREAERELKESWRMVINTLDRESMFV